MSSSLLKSISDFLEREMDECIYFLYDVTSMTTEEPDSMDRSSKLAELRYPRIRILSGQSQILRLF